MSSIDVNNAPAADWTPDQDLGPLAWVLDELRKSLGGAVKVDAPFLREAEQAQESDLASLDAGSLRIAATVAPGQRCAGMVAWPSSLVLRAMERCGTEICAASRTVPRRLSRHH